MEFENKLHLPSKKSFVMKNQENIKVSIPNLCHEEWNAMTPNEKGAFCGKCCKTVIDFTKKTAEEITSIIKNANENSICGRFLSKQIVEPQQHLIPLTQNLSTINKSHFRIRSFAIATFIVFGTTLFSCSTTKNTGESITCTDTIITDTNVDDIEYPMMGAIAPVQIKDSTASNSDDNNPKEYIKGKIKRD